MSGIMYRGLSYLNPRVFLNDSVGNAVRTSAVRYFSTSHKRNMKLVQFTYKSGDTSDVRVGYLDGNNVVDVNKADSSLSSTLLAVLRNGDLQKVKKYDECRIRCSCARVGYIDGDNVVDINQVNCGINSKLLDILQMGDLDKVTDLKSKNPPSVPLSSVRLAAPIQGMDKILCIGLNYRDHCAEQNLTPPPVPMIFSKFASSIIGPNDPLKIRSKITKKVDWEVELAVVIGKKASDVKAADAFDYVMGYTVAQDISARDWQKEKNAGQFLLGKSMDGFCPIGPCIVTSDEIGDPQKLNIRASVNGEQKQNSNTDQLIHSIPDVIERLSSVMTLLPGDMILTGTPGGVGMYRKPPQFLKAGDVIESEIQNIGILTTKVEDF